MNFARALVRDFVDKRLWPAVLLFVAALIAVPLLLGGGGDNGAPAPAPAAAVPATPATQPASAVELVGPPSVRDRPGRLRDPFRRPKPKIITQTVTATPSSTATAPAASTPKGTTTTPTTPTTTPPVTVPTVKPYAYRTVVRFGPADQTGLKAHAISRLTPLGGKVAPALVYLGVSLDGTYAVFLTGPTATASGDGSCGDERCRIIGLRAGKSERVEVPTADGTTRAYTLDVVSVKRDTMASESDASRARNHVNPDGRDVLRAVIHDRPTAQAIIKFAYVPSLGVIVSRSSLSATSATGGSSATNVTTSAP